MLSHAEVNHRARELFVTLPIKEAEQRIATLHQFASIGLDAQAV